MIPIFMIKYGEKEHLQQIVDGKIRFAPSQSYITLEAKQHNKGQGDLLEGKLKIKTQNVRLHDIDTGELRGTLPPNSTIVVSIQDVNDMPVFCISQYGEQDVSNYIDSQNYTITLPEDKLNGIRKDFPKATHALIIIEPDKFINDVLGISGHRFINDSIHYYDYDINPLQMLMYLTTGSEGIQTNSPMSFTYDNKYRSLLCKDIAFEKQDEYRFIEMDSLIKEPISYNFTFTSKYLIVPIEALNNSLEIKS